jgi:hypothetical protein
MKGWHDLILANGYTNDRDIVKGGSGYDTIKVNDGDPWDKASGGGRRLVHRGHLVRSRHGLLQGERPLEVH